MADNKDVDQIAGDYFDSIERSTKEQNNLADRSKELSGAYEEGTDTTLEAAITHEDLAVSVEEYSAALKLAKDHITKERQIYRDWLKSQMAADKPVVSLSSSTNVEKVIPVKIMEDETTPKDMPKSEEQEQEDRKDDEKETREGFFKRIKTSLDSSAKEGEGIAKTFGARALLSVGGTLSTIMATIMNSIPGYQQAKTAINTVKSATGEVIAARKRGIEAREEKEKERLLEKEKEKEKETFVKIPSQPPRKDDSQSGVLDQVQKEREQKLKEEQTENTEEQLKETRKSNKFLDLIGKRMMFGMLLKFLAPLMTIGAAVGGALKAIGLVSALTALKGVMTGLISSLAGLRNLFPPGSRTPPATTKRTTPRPSPTGTQPGQQQGRTTGTQPGQQQSGRTAAETRTQQTSRTQPTRRLPGGAGAARFGLRAIPVVGAGMMLYDFGQQGPTFEERVESEGIPMAENYRRQYERTRPGANRGATEPQASTEREFEMQNTQTNRVSAQIAHYERMRERNNENREVTRQQAMINNAMSQRQVSGGNTTSVVNNEQHEYKTIMVQPSYRDNINRANQGAR